MIVLLSPLFPPLSASTQCSLPSDNPYTTVCVHGHAYYVLWLMSSPSFYIMGTQCLLNLKISLLPCNIFNLKRHIKTILKWNKSDS